MFLYIHVPVSFDEGIVYMNISAKNKHCVIHIYAFSRRFYPKRLSVHSVYMFLSVIYLYNLLISVT